jgi:hypothetical protein
VLAVENLERIDVASLRAPNVIQRRSLVFTNRGWKRPDSI